MSNLKYSPMQILRDNIKLEIEQSKGLPQIYRLAKIETYNSILNMIESDSLGKPLLQQEAELLGIEIGQEEELPKKGQIVWVRDNDGQRWVITHFKEKEDNRYFCSAENNYNEAIGWNQLTTQNPYEEKDREPQVGDMCYFWDTDTQDYVLFGELVDILSNLGHPFQIKSGGIFKHCSLKNPLIK